MDSIRYCWVKRVSQPRMGRYSGGGWNSKKSCWLRGHDGRWKTKGILHSCLQGLLSAEAGRAKAASKKTAGKRSWCRVVRQEKREMEIQGEVEWLLAQTGRGEAAGIRAMGQERVRRKSLAAFNGQEQVTQETESRALNRGCR